MKSSLLLLASAVASVFSPWKAAPPRQAAPAGQAAPKGQADAAAKTKQPPALVPVDRPDDWWKQRFNAMNERVKQGGVDLVFLGDSITQGWETEGKQIWAARYAPRKAVNLGIGGDQTQHVLWRLDHGNVDGITPKLVVLMIGTNNTSPSGGANAATDQSSADIAAGVKAIVDELGKKLPKTQVLLLAIFPRGEKPNAQREQIAAINQQIAKLDDGKRVHYLDIGSKFVRADGSIAAEIMPDFLHLSPKGYELWADAIEPELKKAMGEK